MNRRVFALNTALGMALAVTGTALAGDPSQWGVRNSGSVDVYAKKGSFDITESEDQRFARKVNEYEGQHFARKVNEYEGQH